MTYFLDHPDETDPKDAAGHTDEEIADLEERGWEDRDFFVSQQQDRREYEGEWTVLHGPPIDPWENLRSATRLARRASETSGVLFVDLESPFDPNWASRLGVDLGKDTLEGPS